jgi:hypothetical protein
MQTVVCIAVAGSGKCNVLIVVGFEGFSILLTEVNSI